MLVLLSFLHIYPNFMSFGRLIVHMQADLWLVMLLPSVASSFCFHDSLLTEDPGALLSS